MASPFDPQSFTLGGQQQQNQPVPMPGGADGGMNPQMMQMLMQMLAPQQQQMPQGPDFGSLLTQMRNDPQGDRNKSYIPGEMNGSNPFSNGFFNFGAKDMTPEARMATQGRSAMNQWAQKGQVPGVDAGGLQSLMGQMTPLPGSTYSSPEQMVFSDPKFLPRIQQQFFGEPFKLLKPTRNIAGGGLEGMIDPNLPEDQRFKDANQFTVMPGTSLKPGQVAGDGQMAYMRPQDAANKQAAMAKKKKKALGSPLSGFKFGTSR